jgi:hypothetical protein
MSGIILAIGYTALFLLLMRQVQFFSKVPGLTPRWLSLIFLLKVLAGTALWAIYTWIYPDRSNADVFKYFDDSTIMFGALSERPMDYFKMLIGIGNDSQWFSDQYYSVMNNWYRKFEGYLYNDSHTLIRFNALIHLFSFGEFHVHTVFAAFLSLTGMVGIYRAFVGFLGGKERALMIAVFLLPSVLLWGSGVIKESLLFFGLGSFFYVVMNWIQGRINATGLVVMLGTGMLLFFLKFYVLLSLLPALILFGWAYRIPFPSLLTKALVIYGACAALVLSTPYIVPGFDILETIVRKQHDFIGLVKEVGSGSFVMPPLLEPEIWSFISLVPYALYITFFGPLIHSPWNALGLISIAENLFFLAFIAMCLIYRSKVITAPKGLLLSLMLYVILLSLIIGWTTPVMGALVRYRTPLLPFLLIAGLFILDTEKLYRRWPGMKLLISA